jgi:FkbM family methyltransferase
MSLRSRAVSARRKARQVGAVVRSDRRATTHVPDADSVAAMVQRDQSDAQNMRRLLAFTLSADSSCIDIGAHHGDVLAEMLRIAPHGRHLAFEPLPNLCKLLRERFPGVEVHEAALSNHAGEATFAHLIGPAEGWSGLLFRPLPGGQEAEVEQIVVQLEVLDDVLDPEFRPTVIKIDVEGAEQQVLQGAMKTLQRHQPIVIFEHGSGSAESYGTGPADIHNLLTGDAGLRVFDLDGSGPYSLEQFEHTFYARERVNFVARP